MADTTRGALSALVDTLLPSVAADSGGPAYPAASSVGVDVEVARLIAGLVEPHRREFASFLRAVESPAANLLLTGRAVRFTRLSPELRERYLWGWARSRLAVKRKGFQATKRLAAAVYFSRPLGPEGHPLWQRIRYAPPAPPPAGSDEPPWVPLERPERDEEVTVDLCVVGSGAGGSVIAARAAEAGYRVMVLEAGAWYPAAQYPRVEREAYDRLFRGRGVVPTRDSAISILAGETVGGSTAVNWMTCLPPLPIARAEWANEGGMVGVDGDEFDRDLATVAARLHVSTEESPTNPANEALRRGSIALGYRQGRDWDVIPRNAVGCASRCGFCTFGCPYGARQSMDRTYLADALRAGARLRSSTSAEVVELSGGRVTAVLASYSDGTVRRAVRVRARAVVLAAGALETPGILLRSGVRSPGVGRGLRLDPTTAIAGEFAFPVRTWEGAHQTIGVYRFRPSDAADHGPWIEASPAHPGLSGVAVPWAGASDYRRLMERLEYVATPIVLVRDVGEGSVGIDAAGRTVPNYELTRRDRSNLVRGMIETARILRAAGATRLLSLHTPYVEVGDGRRPLTEAELDTFVAGVARAGVREHAVALFSAHPMGSARAGPDPRRATARPSGEVHGVEGLWIGDGSLLPTAPGANPMLSILALAERTARALLRQLGTSR